MSSHETQSPACLKCNHLMVWSSEQTVNKQPVQVFHCAACDQYAAVGLNSNGVKTVMAPPLVASM